MVPLGDMVLSPNSTSQSVSSSVNIGALVTFDSIIGRVVKTAIQAAADDVNAGSNMLPRTKMNVIQDTNCSGFMGTMEALELIEKDVIAIIEPQSSTIPYAISQVSTELRVPLLSFAATDPTLSAMQYSDTTLSGMQHSDPTLSGMQHSYFLRTIHRDYFQMKAIADFVDYFQRREVIAIFVDDDYRRSGISALGDALAAKRAKIS